MAAIAKRRMKRPATQGQLPVQYLKIDIDFLRHVTRSSQDIALVRAIVSLARDFGQRTIAEGVEAEPTADALRELGVTYAQRATCSDDPHPPRSSEPSCNRTPTKQAATTPRQRRCLRARVKRASLVSPEHASTFCEAKARRA